MNKFGKKTNLILSSLMLLGCGTQYEKNENSKEIVFWHSFVAASNTALVELINDFEKDNPGINIKPQYIPTGDALVQKLVTAIQSNSAPDIAWVHSDFMEKLVNADAIYDLSEFIKGQNGISSEELEQIYPVLLEESKWKGIQYALPMEATSLALVYNKDLFSKAGLNPGEPPKTWDELLEFSIKLSRDENNDGALDVWGFYVPSFPASGSLSTWMVLQFLPFLWQAGGELIDNNQSKVLFNSNAGVEALTLWKTIFDSLNLKKFSLAHDMAFMSQRVAMVLDGPWNLPNYRKIDNFNWGVAPLPAGEHGNMTYLAGEKLVIFKQSEVPNESWTFLRWMIKPEVQAKFSQMSGYLPVNFKSLDIPAYRQYLKTDPGLKAFIDQANNSRMRKPVDRYQVEINQALAQAIENVLHGDAEIKLELDKAAEKCNRLLSDKEG